MKIDPVFNQYYPRIGQPIGLSRQSVLPGVTGTEAVGRQSALPRQNSLYYPGVVAEISPEAWDAYNRDIANKGQTGLAELARGDEAAKKNALPGIPKIIMQTGGGGAKGVGEVFEAHECQTCKNRKYQDSSNDPSVSMQAPTRLSPGQAAGAVAAHEGQHVAHEQARAEREDRQVVSQTVTINTSICPECGRVYVSGGVTRTVTASKPDNTPEIAPTSQTPPAS